MNSIYLYFYFDIHAYYTVMLIRLVFHDFVGNNICFSRLIFQATLRFVFLG